MSKRWTQQDKDNGVFPPVGEVALWVGSGDGSSHPIHDIEVEVIHQCLSSTGNMGVVIKWVLIGVTRTVFTTALRYLQPMETEEEKALREENEFIAEHCDKGICNPFPIYEQGFRACYRALKNQGVNTNVED